MRPFSLPDGTVTLHGLATRATNVINVNGAGNWWHNTTSNVVTMTGTTLPWRMLL